MTLVCAVENILGANHMHLEILDYWMHESRNASQGGKKILLIKDALENRVLGFP